jgi:hypothetical protein
MITGPQCRAARALVEVTRGKLSIRSGMDEALIEAFERKLHQPEADAIGALKTALELLGAVFIEENGGGIGVRLKFTQSEARRIARLESEGGIVASDRVP